MCGGLANTVMVSEPVWFSNLDPFFSMASESSSHLLPFNTLIHTITIKLSSSNYLLWKSQLLPFLESQNLFTPPWLFPNTWLLMVLLSLILLSIDLLLVLFSTWPLRIQILPMLSILSANFCTPLLQIIFLLSSVFFTMLRAHSTLALLFVHPLFLVH